MLRRVRHFLQTGTVLKETCFPSTVVRLSAVPRNLTASDRLFYRQYDQSNPRLTAFLRDLTGDAFEDGAIARILARKFGPEDTRRHSRNMRPPGSEPAGNISVQIQSGPSWLTEQIRELAVIRRKCE